MTKRVWNHESNSFYEAVGVTKEQYEEATKKFNELVTEIPDGHRSHSRLFQLLIDNFDPVVGLMLLETVTEQRLKMELLTGLMGSI